MPGPPEISALRERAKELRCLYKVQEAVADRSRAPHDVFRRVLEAMPEGWQHPEAAGGRIEYLGRSYVGRGHSSEGPRMSAPIVLWGTPVGLVEIADPHPLAISRAEPFLSEERELLETIAARLGEYLEWKHQELVGDPIGAGAHWRWRQQFAERLAAVMDARRFGVRAIYLHGSTENGEAGPGSDIDLVVVYDGRPEHRHDLELWLEGWSLCLAELAYQQTGSPAEGGLLNITWCDSDPDPRELYRMRALPLRDEG